MNDITHEDRQKLEMYASTEIKSYVKRHLAEFHIEASDDEILSEIWNQYSYLVRNFREGPQSLTSYCYQYAGKRALNAFVNEWKRQKKHVEFTDSFDRAYIANPAKEMIMKEMEIDGEVVLNPKIREVLLSMRGDDLQMAKMYLHGITLEKIGAYFGIKKDAVLKRLRKYAN